MFLCGAVRNGETQVELWGKGTPGQFFQFLGQIMVFVLLGRVMIFDVLSMNHFPVCIYSLF